MSATTIAIANQKGGVGKTSCAVNISYTAAAAGKKTLLVDMDPQGNIGVDLGYAWSSTNDHGQHLLDALTGRTPLRPVITDIRPGLDVVSSGYLLKDAEDILTMRQVRGVESRAALRDALEPLTREYDLVVIDTPPTSTSLLQLALVASRWVLIPTKSDRASISGLSGLAQEMVRARATNPDLDALGAVLFDVSTNASVVRRNAAEDINSALQGAAPLFDTAIRHVEAAATQSREEGLLPVELAQKSASAAPFWQALREGRTPDRSYRTASSLAEDYIQLAAEIFETLAAREDEAA